MLSFNNRYNYTTSRAASLAAMTSASVVEIATDGCWWLSQLIAPSE